MISDPSTPDGRPGCASFAGCSVATFATGAGKRVRKLLILKGRFLRYPTPRVFREKSAEVIENKGRKSGKERKERSRVRKRKEIKEIEEVKEVKGKNPATFVRDNTRNDI